MMISTGPPVQPGSRLRHHLGFGDGRASPGQPAAELQLREQLGGTTLEQVPGDAYLDNPINDVAAEEPPMGSSNGIAQLELGRNQAVTGVGTAFTRRHRARLGRSTTPRSSRDPSGANDIQGLNFVAYAKDGVAPLIWSEAEHVKARLCARRS